jgi:hypothetical protein
MFPHAIQKPIFPAPSTVYEGGGDGHGFGRFIFLEMRGPPSHRPGFETKIFQFFYFPQNYPLYLLFYPVIASLKP